MEGKYRIKKLINERKLYTFRCRFLINGRNFKVKKMIVVTISIKKKKEIYSDFDRMFYSIFV